MAESYQHPHIGLTGKNITLAAIAVNGLLAGLKIAVGFTSGSQTIFADGLHSGSDLMTDLAVLAGMRVSDKPADECHPYGHRRVGTLVALIVGGGLIAGACIIAYNAIEALRQGPRQVYATWPLVLAVATIPIKEILFRLTKRVGEKKGDLSLLANAWHHRSDAFTSLAAAAGLAGVLIGGPSWCFLDSAMGLVLSAFVLVVAVKIMKMAASELVDKAPKAELLAGIGEIIMQTDGVRNYHAMRARKIGGRVSMDIHIQVKPSLTVEAGHEIASQVQTNVLAANRDVLEVIVHVEPAFTP